MRQLSRDSRLPALQPAPNDGLIGRSAQGRQRGWPYDLDMDDAHALIELHFAGEPEEAAALRRIMAAVPECRSAVLQLLADRAGALATCEGGLRDSTQDAMTSGSSVTRRLRTVSQ